MLIECRGQQMLTGHMERELPSMSAKPRILICAPSNAAADELLQRVMDDKFADADGQMYCPNVIRIGASSLPPPLPPPSPPPSPQP